MLLPLLLGCGDGPPLPARRQPLPAALEVAQGAAASDRDRDGWTFPDGDCDDTSAAVRPGAQEVCNGVDDDCDGQLDEDDDSVDRYSCGYCPDPALFDATALAITPIDPCALDPAATCSTHVHRRVERADGHPFRDELLLFLPPGPGIFNRTIMEWGAWSGYRAISLGWLNDDHDADCQGDEPCVLALREEQLYGTDSSPWVDIAPNDAVVGRLGTLLASLAVTEPDQGWERYWSEAEGVRWDRIVVFGWSWGAGQTAYVAHEEIVAAALMISGPDPAPWLEEPSATPACAEYALFHVLDELGVNGDLVATLEGMGVAGPAVDVDTTAPPYGDARILTTASSDFQRADCSYHGAVAYDGCMDAGLAVPYSHLFCSLANTPECP